MLDLHGDGVRVKGVEERPLVFFDVNGDGFTTLTGWPSPDDGFLARDGNANGFISSGSELFIGPTVAYDRLTGLASLDSNGDGVIDAADAGFGDLVIWRDANSNGYTEAGETTILAAAGIATIDLTYLWQWTEVADIDPASRAPSSMLGTWHCW